MAEDGDSAAVVKEKNQKYEEVKCLYMSVLP